MRRKGKNVFSEKSKNCLPQVDATTGQHIKFAVFSFKSLKIKFWLFPFLQLLLLPLQKFEQNAATRDLWDDAV